MSSWPKKKLGELTDIVQISRGVPTVKTRTKGEIPVLSVALLNGGGEARAFMSRDEIKNSGADLSQPGDVVIAVEGGSIGESFLVNSETEPFIPSQQAVTVRILDPKVLIPEFFAAWLMSPSGEQQLRRLVRGAAIKRIAFLDLKTLLVPIAPIEIQNEIAELLLGFNNAIASHVKVLEYLTGLRDTKVALLFAEGRSNSELLAGAVSSAKRQPTKRQLQD